ncbi:fibronectin type III domain-containing protein, partial [bacterium]|nr:fibronectin type III domain-containing protein [bacterium]
MRCNSLTVNVVGAFLASLLVHASPMFVQAHATEEITGNGQFSTGMRSSFLETAPTAFFIVDIQLSGEDGVSLSWSDLGDNFVYTVEYCDSLVEGDWDPVPPEVQWPAANTSWTDTSASSSGTRFYRIITEALFDPPSAPTEVTAAVSEGEVVISWSPVPGASSYNVYWSTDEKLLPAGASKVEDVSLPFTHSGLDFGVTYYYVVTAVGNKGESEVSSVVSVMFSPPLDTTVATTMHTATEFLYTGDNPIQTGVAEGTIEPRRVAVLRGKVLTRDGELLSGVTITALNHPEYGQTLTRDDGMFDMAVNGGGYLTVDYQKEGYLPAQRQVNVPWQDYVWLPNVVLITVDTQVTVVDFSEPIQVAQGSPVTDDDGARQATVLFPQDTQAQMVMPDGSTQPISTLSVRATEYTVGDNGPEAMPAELPPTSGYTYCVEFTADEALAASATDVQFDKPLYFYVENFLGFPVGGAVPSGYYDREQGQWIASENG